MQPKRANDRRKSSPRDRSESNKQVVELFIPSDEKLSPRQLIIERLKEANQWNDNEDELDGIYIRGKKDQDYKRLKDNMAIQRGDSIIIKRIKKDCKDNTLDEVTPANNTKTEPSSESNFVNEEFYTHSGSSTPHSSYSVPHTPYSSGSSNYFTPESSPRPGPYENNTNTMHPNVPQPILGPNNDQVYYDNNGSNNMNNWPRANISYPDPTVQYYPNQGTSYPVNLPNQQFWTQYNGNIPQFPPHNNYQQ